MQETRIPQNRDLQSLTAAILLACITGCLVFVLARAELPSDQATLLSPLEQVLIILIGMTAFAAIGAFQNFIQSGREAAADERSKVQVSVFQNFDQSGNIAPGNEKARDSGLENLFAKDKSMRLIKLQQEIEWELLRILCTYDTSSYHKFKKKLTEEFLINRLYLQKEIADQLAIKGIISNSWVKELTRFINSSVVEQASLKDLEFPDKSLDELLETGLSLLKELRSKEEMNLL